MGDQIPSLDRFDGLHSALVGILNGGMTGFGLAHSDIGGYTSLDYKMFGLVYQRDEEILQRWIEMSTFSDAVMRTHPSLDPDFNFQIWDNEEIAGFFKKFVEVFIQLGDYRLELMKELEETGIPITRSFMLEFDNTDRHIDDQFMLGPDVMMAPVFTQGATSRQVFFPEGKWKRWFSGEIIEAGS